MTVEFDAKTAQSAKEETLSALPNALREEDLIKSWKRSQAALGNPENIVDVPHVPEGLLDEHLLDMFRAPMNRFAEDLQGTGLALLLADSRGQILQRWFEDRQAESHLDRVGTVRGAVLAENVVGTNGVGTVVATGKGVQIRGTEHFADFYQDAVCTGSPVLHPITKKLMAVVTLSCDMTPRSDLLKPLVRSMTTQLEQHLMSVEQPSAREMFNVFLDFSRGQPTRVVGFGPQGVMVQSTKANSLTPHDMNLLRLLGEEGRPTGKYVIELSSGPTPLEFTSLGSSNSVVVVGDVTTNRASRLSSSSPASSPLVRNIGRSPDWLAVVNQVQKFRALREPVILLGETGVGKTSLGLGLPYKSGPLPTSTALSDAAERHILGTRQWLVRLAETIGTHDAVVIRGIEALDAPALEGMKVILDSQPPLTSIIMTMTTDNKSDIEAAELSFNARCLWVPPLRDRTEDLPELWHEISHSASPRASLEPNAETMALMRTYSWPGNIKELRRLIGQFAASGKTGPIFPVDLPVGMQSSKTLSRIERVELEAIRKALQEAKGNRVKAADILGISRATVYRKMKAYKISAE